MQAKSHVLVSERNRYLMPNFAFYSGSFLQTQSLEGTDFVYSDSGTQVFTSCFGNVQASRSAKSTPNTDSGASHVGRSRLQFRQFRPSLAVFCTSQKQMLVPRRLAYTIQRCLPGSEMDSSHAGGEFASPGRHDPLIPLPTDPTPPGFSSRTSHQ